MRLLNERIDPKDLKTQVLEEDDAFGTITKSCYIIGPFMVAEERNKNGRIYKESSVEREVGKFLTEKIKQNRAAGELDHPESPNINLDRISHYITDLQKEGNVVYGKAKLANTPMGKIAQTLVKDGFKLGVSSRALGTVSDDGEVSEDFCLITVDLVSDPSAPGALVNAIYENKEYIMENGKIFEKAIETLTKTLNKIPNKNQNLHLTLAIKSFINSL